MIEPQSKTLMCNIYVNDNLVLPPHVKENYDRKEYDKHDR